MAYNLKEVIANKPSRFTEGHRMCAGCGAPVVGRMIMRALKPEDHAVVTNATGCMEVSTFIYPYTAWTDSFIHTAFECAGATLAGVEAAYKSLKKQNKLQGKDTKFIAFGGDGGTYDIGIQSLSGAMERGHDMVYVCYDNGAYMNTGIQRSSATPKFAEKAQTILTTKPWATLGYGALALIVVPVVCFILFCTVIGIIPAIILLLAYIFVLSISSAIISIPVGRMLCQKMKKDSKGMSILMSMVAFIVIWLVRQLPIIGGIATLFANLFALGLIINLIFDSKSRKKDSNVVAKETVIVEKKEEK